MTDIKASVILAVVLICSFVVSVVTTSSSSSAIVTTCLLKVAVAVLELPALSVPIAVTMYLPSVIGVPVFP